MQFYTYILQSEKSERYYIGHIQDLTARLLRHDTGMVTATRNKGPWKLVCSKNYSTKIEANGLEH